MVPPTLGGRVRHFRLAAGHENAKAFARLIDVTPETLSRIENDKQGVGVHTLRKIAERTGVSMYEVTTGRPQEEVGEMRHVSSLSAPCSAEECQS